MTRRAQPHPREEPSLPDWRDRIVLDSTVLTGKPVVKATRIAVER
jgi:uncharacterized protein (DUF433 family)